MPKFSVLKQARGLELPFRPLEVTNIDGDYHAFIVRYSGDYIVHVHEQDEFIYIMEGQIDVEMENRTLAVRQGEAVLVPAGTRHRPRCRTSALALVMEHKDLQKQIDD